MAEKIRRTGVQISQGRLFVSTLPSILGLMFIRSLRDDVLDCFQLFQLWKSGVELALTVWCGPRCAHYSSIPQNPSTKSSTIFICVNPNYGHTNKSVFGIHYSQRDRLDSCCI
ncbi:unnamed protein product [Rotaria magnacalcarata]